MKLLKLSALALAISSACAETRLTDLQTTVVVERPATSQYDRQLVEGREEVSFDFERIYSLLQESRNSNTPTTLSLPLGNGEVAEFTVQGMAKHIGQIVWNDKEKKFSPIEHPYLGFEGKTKEGNFVRGFISEQSFSAIIHSAEAGRITVQSKSLQIGDDKPDSRDVAFVEEVDTSIENFLPPRKTR